MYVSDTFIFFNNLILKTSNSFHFVCEAMGKPADFDNKLNDIFTHTIQISEICNQHEEILHKSLKN